MADSSQSHTNGNTQASQQSIFRENHLKFSTLICDDHQVICHSEVSAVGTCIPTHLIECQVHAPRPAISEF